MTEQQNNTPVKTNASDHQANERTFLAWIRTSIGIMGFGFVVVKFSLFIRQIAAALHAQSALPPRTVYSQIIGVLLVALGGITILFAYCHYRRTKKQIDSGTFSQSDTLLKISTALIFISSILLLTYLLHNIN